MSDLWETHAKWWQDKFTDGVDPEYVDQIEPMMMELLAGYDRVLDLGCGEGQLARSLVTRHGANVTGIDPTHAQIDEARERGGAVTYGVAAAAHVPFRDAAFDAVFACLVFEHIDEVGEAIDEVARVLQPGGRFVLALNHPLLQTPESGWIDDWTVEPPEQYWRLGPYLVETHTVEEVEKGIHIPFIHRPLSRYVNALANAGLSITQMFEPSPPERFLERAPGYLAAAAYPRLLVLVASKAMAAC